MKECLDCKTASILDLNKEISLLVKKRISQWHIDTLILYLEAKIYWHIGHVEAGYYRLDRKTLQFIPKGDIVDFEI